MELTSKPNRNAQQQNAINMLVSARRVAALTEAKYGNIGIDRVIKAAERICHSQGIDPLFVTDNDIAEPTDATP